MPRSVPAWVGKTDNTAAPPRVRLRVYERELGLCHRCRRQIGPADRWTLEHVIALANGGRNAEDNLACTCDWCLPIKNAEDVALKAKGAAIRARHLGVRPPSRLRGAGFPTRDKPHSATRPVIRWMDRQEADE